MENRLSFIQVGSGNSYAIHNQKDEIIGFLTRRRCGQFMQWGLEIPISLMEECVKDKVDLIFFPGCQDEIRQKCKELKSAELTDSENKESFPPVIVDYGVNKELCRKCKKTSRGKK